MSRNSSHLHNKSAMTHEIINNNNLNAINTNVQTSNGHLNNLVNYGGAGNNDLGDGQVRLQTYNYGHDGVGNMRRIRTDTNGRLLCSLVGNTSVDGSGTHNHAHVDGSGILKVSQVSSQNVQPSNTANADHASHSQSLAVGLRGRTNISDHTTGTFLLCDSAGHLQCDVLNTANIKLEDLSSTINADNAGHSRSIAVGLRGRTDISDHTSGVFLKSSATGTLNVEQSIDQTIVTTNDAGSTFQIADGSSDTSAVISLSRIPASGKVCFIVEVNSGTGSDFTVTLKASRTAASTQYTIPALSYITDEVAAGSRFISTTFISAHYHLTISNSAGATREYTVSVVV